MPTSPLRFLFFRFTLFSSWCLASSLLLPIGRRQAIHMLSQGKPHEPSTIPEPHRCLEFLRVVGKLKSLKRTGWVLRGVEESESVADHMYRMAMCSFLITDPRLDRSRVMKVAVVHDLAEAVIGDIVPHDTRYTKEEKRRLEEEALRKMCDDIGHATIGEEIVDLWLDYEEGYTAEAKLVKDLDKFDMVLQADEYERAQSKDLQEFFTSTEGCFQHPQVQGWDKLLRAQRDLDRKEEDSGTSHN